MQRNGFIDPEITVEELVEEYPAAVGFLAERGIVCLRCGEPLWGTLADIIEAKNLGVAETIADLEKHLSR